MAADRAGALPPGARLGILGGGQLGRMLALAAARLGIRTHIFAPEGEAPACDVAADCTRAPYEDEDALAHFAARVDAVTYEFENVPLRSAQFVDSLVHLAPGPLALAVAQDRLTEKDWLSAQGLLTAPYAAVEDAASLAAAIGRLGTPALLKTRRLGYDGRGQARIADAAGARQALSAIGTVPAILEGEVRFIAEAAALVVRGADGRAL
ncbi:MAG: ATP-grasp domain-containing protein, partial [Alphaproteobacteria bacterium]|nr:ATP-grasp domain-containing protein [Alphaproteobacteria bacterium]